MKKQILILLIGISSLYASPALYSSNHIVQTAAIPHVQSDKIAVEVSAGELFDKLTILQIKSTHITQPDKLKNIHAELVVIQQTIQSCIPTSAELDQLVEELRNINGRLWIIEDEIRAKEAAQDFDEEFIALARAVYFTNDKRGDVKRQINTLLGSRLMEEKQYTTYEKK